MYWKQRAKVFWLQNGDQNTRFFHKYASARRTQNAFKRIQNEEGVWMETEDEIQGTITSYFSNLFKSSCAHGKLLVREPVDRITAGENDVLMEEISPEEVKYAVDAMYQEKASGLDGLNPAFFQMYWNIVGQDVIEFCRKYMRTGVLPSGVNQTLVCLIPKVKVPQRMTDLHPISLCSVLVRVLSKILANRLKPCLKHLISDKQSAFVEGRLLNDNALIAFEINHYMRRLSQGSNGIARFKIDISKAYDRLEWDYIQNMMIKFGFSELWIARILELITSVSYSFSRNGSNFGDVIPYRGIRQGDPISPYIYIMCAEGLSAIIRRNEDMSLLHGCSIARDAPKISHLLFADDCYFFFRANKMEASVMRRILDRYANISCQMINFSKSLVTSSKNTSGDKQEEVCQQLGVREV